MITKEDWQAAFEEINEEERQRLGDPPTFEEASAFFDGTLPSPEVETVRDKLVAWPDILRCMTAPFPEEDDADHVLTSEQMAADWQKIKARLRE